MAKTTVDPILHVICRLVADQRLREVPDQELVRRFSKGGDQVAFSGLLRRHGAMVLDVCRKILPNEQDAEDAFQATFLVLARKSGAIRKKSSVGSWLYGVAYRTAIKVRAQSTKRQSHEARVPGRTATVPSDDLSWREVQHVLHEELSRLSDRFRAPLVHCYLEGRTQDETALLLGLSKTTLQRRLESGRASLRARLLRRGLGPAVVLAASTWPTGTASAVVRPILLDSTIKAAIFVGAGSPTGLISPRVLVLVEGVLKAMFLTKLKSVSAVLLAVSVGVGMVGWCYRATAQTAAQPQRPYDVTYPKAPQPQQAVQPDRTTRRAERPLADELDALRLEMEALRKEIRATRERVKALEAEVRGQKEQGAIVNPVLSDYRAQLAIGQVVPRPPVETRAEAEVRMDSERNYDAFAEAEAALKKLRQNPHDKQAAEALEKATLQIKGASSMPKDPARTKR
jgi:RNA polymerase sigma factor (sigma-70 family)